MKEYIPKGYTVWARQTLDSEIFASKPDKWFKIWFYIVSTVFYEDAKFFKRGQNVITYREIMQATKASKKQVERCMAWMSRICWRSATSASWDTGRIESEYYFLL